MKKIILTSVFATLLFSVNYGQIVLNEFQASNTGATGIFDPGGGTPDWIEIYNNGTEAVNISGFMLTDTLPEPDKFVFPNGTIMEPDSYIIVWADKDLDEEGFHADFRLKAEGEEIYLMDANGDLIDEVTFGQQESDVSLARIPNGTGDWVQRAPTHGFNNEASSIIGLPIEPEVTVFPYPNPASTEIAVDLKAINHSVNEAQLTIVNQLGQVLLAQSYDGLTIETGKKETIRLNISNLNKGLYFVVINTPKGTAQAPLIVE